MATVAVFNQKGGVGKTTTSLNLTAALAILERSPLAIDLDPQAHLTQSFGLEESRAGISCFYRQEKKLVDLVVMLPQGVGLIPSHGDLSKIDALSGKGSSVASLLRVGLEENLGRNDFPIIIDCCPMLGVLSLNAIIASSKVLIPVSADFLSMQSAQKVEALVRVLEGRFKRALDYRIVLTRFDNRRKLAASTYNNLCERYGDKVCKTRIRENVSLAESPVYGKDIFAYAPNSQGAKDYFALAQELIESGFL